MAQPIRTLLAVEDGLDADDFVRLLSGDDAIRLDSVVPGLDRATAALETQQLDIVVIACRGFSDRAVFLVERAVRLDPARPVIILADGSPAGFVRRIFELGAEDILPLPQSPEQVRFAIHKTVQRRLGANAASGAGNARIVAVLGPKGGTGKTLTSTNLAVALAQRGQRVIVIDLDLQFGDVGLTLGLPPDVSIYNLAMAGGTIDADKIDAYIVDHPSGARALLAPSRPDQASSVTPHLLQEIYTALRPNYDYIVVDTPPGFTAEVITTIDVSSDLVMVGMLDSLSLKNTKLGLETLELMQYDPQRIRLVLNRAQSRVGISQADVIAVLGREPDVFIPSDREIPRAVNEGVPIVLAQPDSEASKAFGALADFYTGPVMTAVEPTSTRAQQPGLFGRLAGRKA